MAEIHDYSPRRENETFLKYTKAFDLPVVELYQSHGDMIRKNHAVEAAKQLAYKAMEDGKFKFSFQNNFRGEFKSGEHHLVQAVFIHPDDFYSLTRDIGALEGGHEIIKKYFR